MIYGERKKEDLFLQKVQTVYGKIALEGNWKIRLWPRAENRNEPKNPSTFKS